MPRCLRTPEVRRDLANIWQFIAEDNPMEADRLLDQFDETFARLAEFPELGGKRDDLRPGMRGFTVGKYIIFYRVASTIDAIEILRIIHGARHLPDQFPS